MIDDLTRRDFLSLAASVPVCAAGAVPIPGKAAEEPVRNDLPPTRIHKVYLAKPVPTWPKPDLDVTAEMRDIDHRLTELAERMPGIQLEGGRLYRTAAEVPDSAAALGNPDGILVFNLTSTLLSHIERLSATGLPTVLFSRPYSGHDWAEIPALRQKGHRIICLATSDFNEIPRACGLIRTAHLMSKTRILYINASSYSVQAADRIRERLGTEIVHISPERVNAAYREVDDSAALQDAHEWVSGAVRVVEPSKQDIANASRLYLALRRLMREERAHAVTINCLGLFAQKQLPAYPCLAFCRMNDLGLVGVCEGDIDSTLTQLIFGYLFDVPGYVSDPVIDTSNDTVIHAHCVSATRLEGPSGGRAPYIIRSHMEDNKGASLQVKMRVGQVITMAKLIRQDTMLISSGTITDNPESDRGCRTKITTKVADARKLLNGYEGGLHRVIFYGDRLRAIQDLAGLMRFQVKEEC
ncbi:MAG TPA: hypothetical protein VE398_04665 [Acidobacteriota bacterium]|nr:hypothetical protein [Acidobacteriota bacterium]